MNKIEFTSEQAGEILLHFDVPQHSIPLGQFVKSAQAIQAIVEDFNTNHFDGDMKYDLKIVPPENGGLLEVILFVLGTGAVSIRAVWAFINSDIGKSYIKGYTKKDPSEFAEELGTKHKELIEGQSNELDSNKLSPESCKLIAVLAALIICGMITGFLESEPQDLQKAGITKKKHRQAYEAKNELVHACVNNPEVRGLGFSRSHNFPIQRKDFANHIVDIPPLEPEEKEIEWVVGVTDIIAYSPNWKKDAKRGWLGDTAAHKEVYFSIEDEVFWAHVKLRDIPAEIYDNLKVQWAYKAGPANKPTNARVLRVLTFNGEDLSQLMTDEQLAEALGDFSHLPPSDQTEMFETTKKEPPKQIIRIRKD